MPSAIEVASSGRAKCRACARTIAKGELRFGEAVSNPYAEGETLLWFHLACAACARSEALKSTLAGSTVEIPDRDWLERVATVGVEHPRVTRIARAERASSGRATCRACRELIEKGALRIALQMFEEGRMSPIGTIHATCASPYFDTIDIMDRLVRLSPELSVDDQNALAALVTESVNTKLPDADGGEDARGGSTEPDGEGAPGLAKARTETTAQAAASGITSKSGR